MKNILKKSVSFLVITILVLSLAINVSASSVNANEIPNDTYIYWEDSTQAYSSRSVYNFDREIDGKDMDFSYQSLSDISNDNEGNSYILDSEASAVFVLDNKYQYKYSFGKTVYNGEKIDFTGAQSIEYRNGKLFICDTDHARVLKMNLIGVIESITYLPESDMIPDDFIFKPIRIAVDSSNYMYVLSEGSYYGAILYSPAGELLGFYGSNMVETGVMTALKTIWEKLTMTNDKRANSAKKLPYQFTDLYIDSMDFVYTATGRTDNADIEKGQIKRLNPGGVNVLKSSDETTFADLVKSTVRFRGATWTIDPNVCSVVADENGFIYAVDREAGKIFIYDGECNHISVFGGGNGDVDQHGAPRKISAIGLNGEDVIVLDEGKNNILIFTRNEYGKMFMEAQASVLNGDYAEVKEQWESVIAADRNNQLAYKGLAKAYLAIGEYDKALEFAEEGKDLKTYDQAYTLLRNKRISSNFNIYAVVVLVVIAGIVVAVYFKKRKHIVLIKSEKTKTAMRVLTSPVDSFTAIKQKQLGSVMIATVLMALCYLSTVAKNEWSGFQFIGNDIGNFNSILTFFKTIGAILLFTIANWGVATLMQGRGTLKEIYIVTCYSLIPLIISNFAYAILTHYVSLSEIAFVNIMQTVLILYMVIMLIFGLMVIHDVSFGRFLGITILSLLGIFVVIFVGVIVFLLAQQLYSFIMTIINELIYR